MVWIGLVIVIITFVMIIKNYETRLVLFISGALMALLGGNLPEAVDTFTKQFVNSALVPIIVTVMGFSYVMNYTKCADHLVRLLTGLLNHTPLIIVPAATFVTWCLNIALPSAAGVSAAVGTLLIPTLIAMRVHPAAAGAAVFLGTWGSVISPGFMFNPLVAGMANTDVMTAIGAIAPACLIGIVVAATLITIIVFLRKEGAGTYHSEHDVEIKEGTIQTRPNVLYAMVPVLPLFLLVIGSKQVGWIPYMSVPQCMILGTVVGIAITRSNPQESTKRFFRGCGDAFCDVIGLICAAALFCAGMAGIGLTGALIDWMKGSQSIAQFAAAAGPFGMAAISGSGNAATLAFFGSVVPSAPDFGYTHLELGGAAQVAGALGRTMSPVAAGCIICSRIAKVNPIEIAKRTAIPTIAAVTVINLLLL